MDQVGMSSCSVLAPTGHRGQTSQTCAEEEHGGRLGDSIDFINVANFFDIINILFIQTILNEY